MTEVNKHKARLPQALMGALPLLACPHCGKKLRARGHSLLCQRGHTHDVSARGYVNFVLNRGPVKGYSKESFEQRAQVLGLGYYDGLLSALLEVLAGMPKATMLDAGCGDGFWASKVARATGSQLLALDNSKEAIRMASRPASPLCWMVGDIARLPLKDASVDVVLNLFAPANYGQFARVLKPGGRLIKLIPGQQHLQELRRKAGDAIQAAAYSPEPAADYFARHCQLDQRLSLSHSLPLTGEALAAFVSMTPLYFSVDSSRLDFSGLTHITIAGEMLVGRIR